MMITINYSTSKPLLRIYTMQKIILTLLLCLSTTALFSMEKKEMILRSVHAQKVAELESQIAAEKAAISIEKTHQAQQLTSAHRTWDLKNAITPAVYGLLVGGKLAYDIYSLENIQEIKQWLDITNLALDGLMATFCLTKTSYHLMRACCRKPKVE